MTLQNRRRETWFTFAWLCFVCFVPCLPLIRAADFFYDDVRFIVGNPDFRMINSFWDCFYFTLQPSKPITNFFMAFAYWAGNGSVLGQRLVSLSIHFANVLLLYSNARLLERRLKLKVPAYFALAVATLYAVCAVHTETLAVAQFRGELLATAFTLIALYCSQKLSTRHLPTIERVEWSVGYLLSLGAAILSKEVFAVVLPILSVLLFAAGQSLLPLKSWTKPPRVKFLTLALAGGLSWSSLLFILLRRDGSGVYSYQGAIGFEVVPPALHVELASRAMLEGIVKIVLGSGLTTVRLATRFGIGSQFPWYLHFAILVTVLVGLLSLLRVRGWTSLWASVLLLGAGVYLAIPNANIGNEHYWYFPATGFFCLFAYGAWRVLDRYVTKAVPLWWGVMGLQLLISLLALESRFLDFKTRLHFVEAELKAHPETASTWTNAVAVYIQLPQIPEDRVWNYIQHAKTLDPTSTKILIAEYFYYSRQGNFEKMRESLHEVLGRPLRPRDISGILLDFAGVSARRGNCVFAREALKSARLADPTNEFVKQTQASYEAQIARAPASCKDSDTPKK